MNPCAKGKREQDVHDPQTKHGRHAHTLPGRHAQPPDDALREQQDANIHNKIDNRRGDVERPGIDAAPRHRLVPLQQRVSVIAFLEVVNDVRVALVGAMSVFPYDSPIPENLCS